MLKPVKSYVQLKVKIRLPFQYKLLKSYFIGHSSGISCVLLSTDGKRIISSSLDTTIKVWNGINY